MVGPVIEPCWSPLFEVRTFSMGYLQWSKGSWLRQSRCPERTKLWNGSQRKYPDTSVLPTRQNPFLQGGRSGDLGECQDSAVGRNYTSLDGVPEGG